MPRGGRKMKLTKALQNRFCAALRKGATRKAACGVVGVSPSTFYRWMSAGETSDSGIQKDFREAIIAAESKGEQNYVSVVDQIAHGKLKDADGNEIEVKPADRLKAALAMLEKRYGWGTTRVEISGPEGKPVRVEGQPRAPRFSDEQYEKAAAAFRDGDDSYMHVMQAAMAAEYGRAAEAK